MKSKVTPLALIRLRREAKIRNGTDFVTESIFDEPNYLFSDHLSLEPATKRY